MATITVSSLDFGLRCLGSLYCVLGLKTYSFTVPLSNQEYKYVQVNCQGSLRRYWGGKGGGWGVGWGALGWNSIPSRGE